MIVRLAAVAALLAGCGSLAAQSLEGARSPSHLDVPTIDSREATKIFAERLKQIKRQSDVLSLLQPARGANGAFDLARFRKMFEENPELLERARAMLGSIDLNDPNLRQLIGDVLRQNNWAISPDLVMQQLEALQRSGGGSGEAGALMIPKPPRGDQTGTAGTGQSETARNWSRDIVDWVNRMPKDQLTGTLRNSPALQDFLRDLTTRGGMSGGPMSESLDVQLNRWAQRWDAVKGWLPEQWPEGLKLNLEGLGAGDVRMPDLRLGDFRSSTSASSIVGAAADFLPILYIALAGLMVYTAFRLLRARRTIRGPEAETIGPWPVAPSEIGSREQLIRAFDHLALVRCGVQARSWHHRAVARRLPRGEGERPAAVALASAYEWARYAPDRGEVPAGMLADARRNLEQLAEGAA